jgi:putative ABC transport system permease protein
MLGVIISVAAVIAAVAIATGAHARVTAQIQSLGLNLLLVLSGSFSAGGIRRGAGTLQPSPRTTPGRYAAASAATSYTSRHA